MIKVLIFLFHKVNIPNVKHLVKKWKLLEITIVFYLPYYIFKSLFSHLIILVLHIKKSFGTR